MSSRRIFKFINIDVTVHLHHSEQKKIKNLRAEIDDMETKFIITTGKMQRSGNESMEVDHGKYVMDKDECEAMETD